MPSNSAHGCIRIIRLEFGSIHELVSTLLELLEGRKLGSGSIILLFSATHLSYVGIAGYIEDMVAARKRISAVLGGDIYMSTAPPLIMCGMEREETIRDVFDLQEWIVGGVAEEIQFKAANAEALCSIMENGYGGAQTEHKARIWLPVSLSGPLAQKIWSTGGNTSLPCASGPTNESQEKTIMEALIHDLKSKLAIDLDESPATLRKMGSAAAVGGANYLVVGSSNARRLAAALNA